MQHQLQQTAGFNHRQQRSNTPPTRQPPLAPPRQQHLKNAATASTM
jgi:hypothetical protein